MSIVPISNDITTTEVENDDDEIINWEEEAAAIIKDVSPHVKSIDMSRQLPNNENRVYLNVRTIEGQDFSVQVSSIGFRVVGNAFDTIDADKEEVNEDEKEVVYETPYALLDKISPRYVESFGNQLCKQLLTVQQMRTQFNEEDEEGVEDEDEADCDLSKAT